MPIRINNQTHWRTSDIKRLVKGAYEAGGFPTTRHTVCVLVYYDNDVTLSLGEMNQIRISLTKRGTNQPRPLPMVALAATAIANETTVYPFQSVYWLANYLAWKVSSSPWGDKSIPSSQRDSILPPAWDQSLYIAKYADPRKDATFVAFAEKKRKEEIDAAQARVDKWSAEADKWSAEKARVDKNLARATKERRVAQKSLRDAKKRRES